MYPRQAVNSRLLIIATLKFLSQPNVVYVTQSFFSGDASYCFNTLYKYDIWRRRRNVVYVKKTPKSRICHLRNRRQITQAELARRWGVSNVTVQNWEKETSKAHHLVHLVLLCHLLSCTPRDLVSYLPPSSPRSNLTKNLEHIRQQMRQEEHSDLDNSPPPVTRLAELRESKGFTQSQIAEALDVSEHTIQNWERGRTSSWQFVQFIKLCDILYCAPEELVDNIPEERLNAVKKLLQNQPKVSNYPVKELGKIRKNFRNCSSEVCIPEEQFVLDNHGELTE
jgi:transcriptional regulator with XRE-family HTH domain